MMVLPNPTDGDPPEDDADVPENAGDDANDDDAGHQTADELCSWDGCDNPRCDCQPVCERCGRHPCENHYQGFVYCQYPCGRDYCPDCQAEAEGEGYPAHTFPFCGQPTRAHTDSSQSDAPEDADDEDAGDDSSGGEDICGLCQMRPVFKDAKECVICEEKPCEECYGEFRPCGNDDCDAEMCDTCDKPECHLCDKVYCPNCAQNFGRDCLVCGRQPCPDCDDQYRVCDNCEDEEVCPDCYISDCDICGKLYCEICETEVLTRCITDDCDNRFCERCGNLDLRKCQTCLENRICRVVDKLVEVVRTKQASILSPGQLTMLQRKVATVQELLSQEQEREESEERQRALAQRNEVLEQLQEELTQSQANVSQLQQVAKSHRPNPWPPVRPSDVPSEQCCSFTGHKMTKPRLAICGCSFEPGVLDDWNHVCCPRCLTPFRREGEEIVTVQNFALEEQ